MNAQTSNALQILALSDIDSYMLYALRYDILDICRGETPEAHLFATLHTLCYEDDEIIDSVIDEMLENKELRSWTMCSDDGRLVPTLEGLRAMFECP